MLNGKYEINNVDKDSAGMFNAMLYYTWVDLIPLGSITGAHWDLPLYAEGGSNSSGAIFVHVTVASAV